MRPQVPGVVAFDLKGGASELVLGSGAFGFGVLPQAMKRIAVWRACLWSADLEGLV